MSAEETAKTIPTPEPVTKPAAKEKKPKLTNVESLQRARAANLKLKKEALAAETAKAAPSTETKPEKEQVVAPTPTTAKVAAKIKPAIKEIITPASPDQQEEENSSEEDEFEWNPPPPDLAKKEAKLKQQKQIEELWSWFQNKKERATHKKQAKNHLKHEIHTMTKSNNSPLIKF